MNHAADVSEKLQQKGDKKARVMVSFDEKKDKNFVRDFVADTDAELEQIFDSYNGSSKTTVGSYFPPKGMDAEEALEKMRVSTLVAVEKGLELYEEEKPGMERRLAGLPEGDDEKAVAERKALEGWFTAYNDLKERYATTKRDGLEFHGVQMRGKGNELAKVKGKNNVRLVEELVHKEDARALPLLPEKNAKKTNKKR